MNTTRTRRSLVAATALASLLLPVAAGTAAARPDAGPAVARIDSDWNCPLRRVDRQLVRCDNLTGGGVAAPLWVPEL
jgi:hypothetical protein